MMWPRLYIDQSKFDTPPERPDRLLGAAHLLDRLKRYRRNVPKTTDEPTGPAHDISSHGADAFGSLAEIVDRIRNEGDRPAVKIAPYKNVDPGMGMLG